MDKLSSSEHSIIGPSSKWRAPPTPLVGVLIHAKDISFITYSLHPLSSCTCVVHNALILLHLFERFLISIATLNMFINITYNMKLCNAISSNCISHILPTNVKLVV